MPDHQPPAEDVPAPQPSRDDVARRAYAVYLKQGRPQGQAEANWLEVEAQLRHGGTGHPGHQGHHDHHAHMAADFRKRFWISLALTAPILVLSPLLQHLVGLRDAIRFPGDVYVLFGLASAVFWYGGWPFLSGLFTELKNLFWATGYNAFAIPLAAGALYAWGVLLSPALGAVLMSASTVIVAINARLLRLR